jgi:hypothetical protein
MLRKTAKVGAAITFVLTFALMGAFMARPGYLAQSGIRASGFDSARDVTNAPRLNGNNSLSSHTTGSPDGSASLELQKKAAHVAANALGLRSKGGGGEVAIFTFLILLVLWCIRGWWIAGRPLPHR